MTLIGLRILSVVTILAATISSSASSTVGVVEEDLRLLQTCTVTICASGDDTQIGSPDLVLPIFPDGATTCAQVAQLLADQDQNACAIVATYSEFLSLGAYCGCTGQDPPGICSACSGGGQVVDPNIEFTVPLLEGLTFTCGQGEEFVSYLTSDLACDGFTSVFDPACCVDGSTPTTPTMSAAPMAAPVITAAPVMGAPVTAAPVAGTTPSPSMMTTTDPSIMPAAASEYPSTVTPATDDSTESPTEGEGPPTRPSATSPSASSPSAPTRPSAPSPSAPSSPSAPTTSAGASLFVGQAFVVALFTVVASTWTMV